MPIQEDLIKKVESCEFINPCPFTNIDFAKWIGCYFTYRDMPDEPREEDFQNFYERHGLKPKKNETVDEAMWRLIRKLERMPRKKLIAIYRRLTTEDDNVYRHMQDLRYVQLELKLEDI